MSSYHGKWICCLQQCYLKLLKTRLPLEVNQKNIETSEMYFSAGFFVLIKFSKQKTHPPPLQIPFLLIFNHEFLLTNVQSDHNKKNAPLSGINSTKSIQFSYTWTLVGFFCENSFSTYFSLNSLYISVHIILLAQQMGKEYLLNLLVSSFLFLHTNTYLVNTDILNHLFHVAINDI